MKFGERRSHRSGKSAFSTPREYFTNNHIIIYLILIYNFTDFATHILFYIIFSISSCHLLLKGTDSLRSVVDARSVRLATHPRFQASSSQALPSPPLGTPVRPKPSIKNSIPVILSGVDEKFKHWRTLMGELRLYHSGLKISRIKELPKGDFVVIGDSVQDVIILQNESKMKAALGKNVKISLPKAFQASKVQAKSLAIKGVPTDITDTEFKKFFDLNKISDTKAERLKAKKTAGSSQSFDSKLTTLPKPRLSFLKI